jgi:2-polyprenyl-3-methyl-5-hydroxy-6-metoxy-1,4-benzoquinol methylase
MNISQATKVALRACPICGSRDATVLHHQRFTLAEGCPLPIAYDVSACDGCSLVYADTPGKQQDYDQYYELFSKYEDPGVATGGGDSKLDLLRVDATASMLADIIAAPTDRARILDIGCAGGGLLRALRKRGFVSLTGLDPSSGCVARVRAEGMEAIKGKVSDLPHRKGPGTYDAIVLSHVLEHVVDVRETMSALHDLVATDGVVYIEVPDATRYTYYPFVPFYYFDAEHINHFDAVSLANLAAANRFRVVASGQKELPVGDQQFYPAVWSVFAPEEGNGTLTPAIELRDRVVSYVAQSAEQSDDAALQRLVAEQRPVALWGAGSHSQRLLKQSALGRCRIVAVVDRDHVKQGKKFAGLEIQAPETGLSGLAPDVIVVIASVLHAKSIARELRALGISNDLLIA